MITKRSVTNAAIVAAAFAFPVFGVYAATSDDQGPNGCANLPSYSQLKSALTAATVTETSGLNNQMWGTIVDRDGMVCAVAFTGTNRGAHNAIAV